MDRPQAPPSRITLRHWGLYAALTPLVVVVPYAAAWTLAKLNHDDFNAHDALIACLLIAGLCIASPLVLWLIVVMVRRAYRAILDAKSEEPALVSAFLADQDVPCPSCGYNLRGVVGNRCPECNQLISLGVSRQGDIERLATLIATSLGIVGVYCVINVVAKGNRIIEENWRSAMGGRPAYWVRNFGSIRDALFSILYLMPTIVQAVAVFFVLSTAQQWLRARSDHARAASRVFALRVLLWFVIAISISTGLVTVITMLR